MENPNNVALKDRKRLFAILNHFIKREDPADRTVEISAKHAMYDANELAVLRTKDLRNGRSTSDQFSNLKGKLQETSDNISCKIATSAEFAAMLPEADKARAIYIPSILSPTDMYGHNLTVTLDGCGIEENASSGICEILSELANTTLDLGTKLQPWLGDALFKRGATPVMVIPRALTRGMLSDIDSKSDEEIPINVRDHDGVVDNSDLTKGVEDLNVAIGESLDITPAFMQGDGGTLNFATESIADFMDSNVGALKEELGTEIIPERLSKLMETLKGTIDVSMDISKVRGAEESVKESVKAFESKAAGRFSKVGDGVALIINSDSMVAQENDEPTVMRLPTSSVIPITIPGSPESRLGFFVVVDKTGNPLNADITSTTEAVISQSEFMTMFREDNSVMVNNLGAEKQSEVASDMFDILINHVLDSSLQSVNESSYNIVNNRELSVAIFSKALRKQKVSFIFVPTTHMAYYAFDYREDGTGKSLLEDASTLISLRTSVIVAKVVSIMDNARDDRRIEYSIPDASSTNVEQMNELLKRMYIDKHTIKPGHDTSTIFRDITSNSISVTPKELDGLKDFTITKEVTQGNLSQVDDRLEEMLTRLITLFLRVPAGAIDDVHEKDFSRSVATSNLLFSNDIRLAQAITCRETAIILKAAALNSDSVVSKIAKILNDSTTLNVPAGTNQMDIVRYIINSLVVSLPAPNVSPDRARLNEVSENIRVLDEVIDALWPDELLIVDDDKAKNALMAYKKMIKHTQVKEMVANSGDKNLSTIPGLDDISPEVLRELNQVMLNISSMATRMKSALQAEDKDADSGGGSRW